MTLPDQEQTKKFDIKSFLLLIGIAGICFNLYYKYDRYYLGETLTEKQVTVNDPPEYVETGKGGTDRYTFSAEGYKCRFWISEGGLSIVRDNEKIENKIKAIKKGELINLKIRQTDEPHLQNESARLRIIELSNGQDVLFSANEVEAKDRKWYRINFGVPITAILIWIFLQIQKFVKSKRKERETEASLRTT